MKVFLDSSVWFAAAFSPNGGSSELMRELVARNTTVLATKQVVAETVRNLQAKGSSASLERFFELYSDIRPTIVEPKSSQVKAASVVINLKDAPILAGAKMGDCRYLITLDRKHFLTGEVARFASPTEILLPGGLLNEIKN